tara:strand:+ start:14682 stop:15401 length:720 start_codon:yes stop_codon:yes gene_type:complete
MTKIQNNEITHTGNSGTSNLVLGSSGEVTPSKLKFGSDAAGDIAYYNGTGYTRLAKGSTGHYLKQGGSNAPEWAAVPSSGRKYTYGSWVATNSGTEVEFSSLTNTVQFAIDWSLVGINANEEMGCLIGDSGGYETSGYHNSAGYNASSSASSNTSSSRWETEGTASSAQHKSGRMHFWNIKDTNHWFMDFQYIVDSEHPFYYWRGLKTLSGTLDRVKFYGVSGATFDQGHMRLVTIEDL